MASEERSSFPDRQPRQLLSQAEGTNREILSHLILVGTVHNDPAGAGRLSRLLERLRPQVILVELSPYSLRYRRKHSRSLKRTFAENLKEAAAESGLPLVEASRHPEIKAVRMHIGMSFEYETAEAFGRERGAKVFAIDHSRFSREWIASWEEMISRENLVSLLSLPRQPLSVAAAYQRAARRIEGVGSFSMEELKGWKPEEEASWSEREIMTARKIVKILNALRPERSLYVGGWLHLAPSAPIPSLRDILGLDASRCLLLDRAT